jgi:predicted nucleic acid-binding protein
MSVIYDAGVLIAAERNDRRVWAEHRVRLEEGIVPITTAPVVAQVSRSAQQVQLRRLLRGCEIVGFGTDHAHDVGSLLGASNTSDVVDAHLAIVASARRALVVTSDVRDIERLSPHLPEPITITRV